MNYYNIYFKLMQKGVSRLFNEDPTRFHAHHIIPRSLGGPDIVLNISLLTDKEHRLAHKILRQYPLSFLEHQGTTRINCTYYLKQVIKKEQPKRIKILDPLKDPKLYYQTGPKKGQRKKAPLTSTERSAKSRAKKEIYNIANGIR